MDLVLTGEGGISIDYMVAELLVSLATFLDSVLPQSMLPNLDLSPYATYLGWVNWLLPVGSMLDLFGAWCAALAGAVCAKSLADRVLTGLGDAAETAGTLVVASV